MLKKTLNGMGFMHQISPFSLKILETNQQNLWLADLGCAYGDFVKYISDNSQFNIDAYDIEKKHLQELEKENTNKVNLYCKDLRKKNAIDKNKYDLIHASHFLEYIQPRDIEQVFENIYLSLKDDGKIYLLMYTPFIKEYNNLLFQKEYKNRLISTFWPGYMENINLYATDCDDDDNSDDNFPKSIHLYNISSISRVLEKHQFYIEYISYINGSEYGAADFTINDGRELLAVIARKI